MRSLSGTLGGAILATVLIATRPTAVGAGETMNTAILLGKWCGESTNYQFTAEKLTVTFHDGRKNRELPIKSMEAGNNWIDVKWNTGGNTIFYEFSDNGKLMHQRPNTSGDMGPKRKFRRC